MKLSKIKLYIMRLWMTSENIVLFRLNSILATLAISLDSETIDNLRFKYGNWYNSRLMQKFINCDYFLKNKRIKVCVENMETLGHLVIVRVLYEGMSKEGLAGYLTSSIGAFMPTTIPNIQISNIDDSHVKVIFPL